MHFFYEVEKWVSCRLVRQCLGLMLITRVAELMMKNNFGYTVMLGMVLAAAALSGVPNLAATAAQVARIRAEVRIINSQPLRRVVVVPDGSERYPWRIVPASILTSELRWQRGTVVQVFLDAGGRIRKVGVTGGMGDSHWTSVDYYGVDGQVLLHLARSHGGGDSNMAVAGGWVYYFNAGRPFLSAFREITELQGDPRTGRTNRIIVRQGVPVYTPYAARIRDPFRPYHLFHGTVADVLHDLRLDAGMFRSGATPVKPVLLARGQRVHVNGQDVNLRALPSRSAAVIRTLDALETGVVIDIVPAEKSSPGPGYPWVKVKLDGHWVFNRCGLLQSAPAWVSAEFLEGVLE